MIAEVTELDLPDLRGLRGEDGSSSAASCLLAVCYYFGCQPHGGGDFERLLERADQGGTTPDDIVRAAQDVGLEAGANPMSVDALVTAIEDGHPVIADLGGRYAVVFGVTTAGLLVMDPTRGHDVLPMEQWPGQGIVLDMPGAERHTEDIERQLHPHEALAHHYSNVWNVLHEQGEQVPHWEMAGAHENLSGTDWHVDLGHDGVWRPLHVEDMQRVYLWPKVEKHRSFPYRHKGHFAAVVRKSWEESKHPRGNPKNPGEFAPKSGGGQGETVDQPVAQKPQRTIADTKGGRAILDQFKDYADILPDGIPLDQALMGIKDSTGTTNQGAQAVLDRMVQNGYLKEVDEVDEDGNPGYQLDTRGWAAAYATEGAKALRDALEEYGPLRPAEAEEFLKDAGMQDKDAPLEFLAQSEANGHIETFEDEYGHERIRLGSGKTKSYGPLIEKAGRRRKVDPQQGLFGQWTEGDKPTPRKTPQSSEAFEGMHPRRGQGSGGGRFAKINTGNAPGQQSLFGAGGYEERAPKEEGTEHEAEPAPPVAHKPQQGGLFGQGGYAERAGHEVQAPAPTAGVPAIEGVHHAPVGGVTIAGTLFAGGQFIPNEELAKATPAVKARVLGHQAQLLQNAENQAHPALPQPTIPTEAAKKVRQTRRRKLEQAHGELLGTEGSGGHQGGLFSGQPLGEETAEEPRRDQAGVVPGTPEEQRPGELPASAGGERSGPGGGPHPAEQHESLPGTAGNGEPATRPVEDEGGRGGREAAAGELEPGREGVAPQTPAEAVLSQPPTPETPTDLSAGNFHYDSRDFFAGGPKAKVHNNLEAIRTLRAIQAEGRSHATPEEQQILSKYVGWGAFAQDLFAYKRGWEREQQELKDLLSDEDYEAARRSTVNAHYTHPEVVDAHWKMAQKLGYKGGRFLETSAGIGYYLGLMPQDTAAQTKSTAVEIDPTSGAILKLLYPGSRCLTQGYQDFDAPNGFYDLVASNVPFDITLYDPKTKRRYRSHDFFFLRSLDHVKPGGLVMHITSRYTMDKGEENSILPELADKAEFVGAVRFPGGRHKENAGTEVVTDLLILRKKDPKVPPVTDETPQEAQPKEPNFTGTMVDSLGRLYYFVDGKRVPGPNWTETTLVPDPDGGEPMEVNKYFADHPEQILGRLDRTGTMRAENQINVSPTDDYEDRLQAAIDRLPENVLRYDQPPTEQFTPQTLPSPGEVRNGGLFVKDGKVYLKDGAEAIEQKVKPQDVPRVEGQLKIRDAMRALIKAERSGEDATQLRAELNRVYDAFVKKFGFLNARANYLAFRADVGDSPALLALEHWNEATKTATKADMFSKETIRPDVPIEKASTPEEALGITLNQKGVLDLDHMAQLLGMDKAALGDALVSKGLAFHDPEGGWQQADDYLSGNVRRKLIVAKAAAVTDPSYQPNVDALEKVQPADKDIRRIGTKLGAPWIPASDVAQFAAELIGEDASDFAIRYVPELGKWIVKYSDRGGRLKNSRATNKIWGTGRPNTNFIDLLEAAMLNKTVRCYDTATGPDGKEMNVLNRDETDKATEKIDEIKEKFQGWIWQDDERRARLHRYYNDNINNLRDIEYDGSHLTFPGMNPEWHMRDVQKNFIWQTIRTGKGFTAHEVGIGKTAQLIASGMELKRMGLVKKPMLAVKKANIDEHTAFARWLYPGARILSLADATDAATRKKMVSQIATGDWDMVIMSHTNMDMIEMLPETQAGYLRDELADLRQAKTSAVLQAAKEGGAENVRRDPTVKELEKAEAALEAKLKEAMDGTRKDNAMYFEDLGIDHILVDEAHAYKSLPPYTRMAQIKGVPNSRSARATNMLMRTRWLMDNNGGRGVVFASGTPVGNTMAELYTFQRYLQPKELEERGLHHFDAWAQTFGDVVTKNEWTHTGKYEPVARFSKFVNLTELAGLTRQFMDVQRVDDLLDNHHFDTEAEARAHVAGLFTPPGGTSPEVTPEMMAAAKVALTPKEGGGFTVTQPAIVRPKRQLEAMIAPKSEQLAAYMESQIKRAEALKGKKVEKGEDNMLVLCTDNKKASVDMRLVDPGAEDDPSSKTNLCVNKVLEIAKARPGVTQLIFSNLRQSKANPNFNLYDDIIDKLVAGGIPREKIADFSQLEGDKRQEVQAAMQNGDILVGIGGTDTLGTGVNVQKKLAALHNLDVPDRPIDIEQRDGRGFRYGNMNDPTKPAIEQNLQLYRYLGEGSADDVFWGRILTKSGFINQVMRSKGKEVPDEIEDLDTDSMSPERFIALIKGDPRVTEMMDLTDEVKKMRRSKERHQDEQYSFRDQAKKMESATPHLERRLQGMRDDLKTLESNPDFSLTVGDKTYTDRKEAGEALSQKIEEAKKERGWSSKEEAIGTYRGLPLVMRGRSVFISGQGDSYATGDTLPSVEAVARRQQSRIGDMEESLAAHKKDIDKVRAEVGKEWTKHEELATKEKRLKELEAELGGKNKEEGQGGGTAPTAGGGGGGTAREEAVPQTPRPSTPAIRNVTDATEQLQAIRTALGRSADARPPAEELLGRVDAIGQFAAAHGQQSRFQPILDELKGAISRRYEGAAKPATPAPAPEPKTPTPRTFPTITAAAQELDSIRNELARPAEANVDRDELLRRVDAVGQWAASGGRYTQGNAVLQREAHQLRDKIEGGSGKGGTRIDIRPEGAEDSAEMGRRAREMGLAGNPPEKPAAAPTEEQPKARGPAVSALEPTNARHRELADWADTNGVKIDYKGSGKYVVDGLPVRGAAAVYDYLQARSHPVPNIQNYISDIHNADKKDYAEKYLRWLQAGEPDGESPDNSGLSYMAAQAVRQNLTEMWRREGRREASSLPPAAKTSAEESAPTSPAPAPANVAIKRVQTKRGERSVHSFSPGESFWQARKEGKVPSNVTVSKNKYNHRWEASIWGANDKEIHETLAELRKNGVRL